jgi:hypothetical protein|tara:strand:+ start:901 stop:1224 length:324 start_codon:yes stop_codon:yes gene_type:complete
MGGSPARVIKKVIQTPVKILSSPLGQRRPEVQQRNIAQSEKDNEYRTKATGKKVTRRLMPRPGSKKIGRSRKGGLLAGDFTRQNLGGGNSIRNPRKAKLGSENEQYG